MPETKGNMPETEGNGDMTWGIPGSVHVMGASITQQNKETKENQEGYESEHENSLVSAIVELSKWS